MLIFLGANYFLSVRQFLEAEKKIRINTLVKHSNLSFTDACKILTSSKTPVDIQEEERKFLELLTFDFGTEFKVGDEEGILFFFAGFCARSEAKNLKCESCIALFVLSKDVPSINFDAACFDDNLGEKRAKFIQQINRGGLFTPTDALYVCVLHARQLYKEVFDKGEIEKKFLDLENPQHVFSAMLEMKMKNDPNAVAILDQTCVNSHTFGERMKTIGDRIYNTFSKNFSQEINDQENKKRKRKSKGSKDPKDSSARKIRKLQNDTNF